MSCTEPRSSRSQTHEQGTIKFSDQRGGYSNDGLPNPSRTLWIHGNAVWANKRPNHLSSGDEQLIFIALSKIHGHFFRRYIDLQSDDGRASTTPEAGIYDPKLELLTSAQIKMLIKQVRAFLGLTGYYCRFINRYAQVATPITNLLKKGKFQWNAEAEEEFKELKNILTTAPVLIYPNFEEPFVLETDACNVGVGAVLLQNDHPHTIARNYLC